MPAGGAGGSTPHGVRAGTAGIKKQRSVESLHAGQPRRNGFARVRLKLRAEVGTPCRVPLPPAVG